MSLTSLVAGNWFAPGDNGAPVESNAGAGALDGEELLELEELLDELLELELGLAGDGVDVDGVLGSVSLSREGGVLFPGVELDGVGVLSLAKIELSNFSNIILILSNLRISQVDKNYPILRGAAKRPGPPSWALTM